MDLCVGSNWNQDRSSSGLAPRTPDVKFRPDLGIAFELIMAGKQTQSRCEGIDVGQRNELVHLEGQSPAMNVREAGVSMDADVWQINSGKYAKKADAFADDSKIMDRTHREE